MSKNTLDPKKQISDRLLTLAKKNKAKSYAQWFNEKKLDTRINSSTSQVNASTKYALANRDLKTNALAQNSGYGEYLIDKARSSYLGAMAKAQDKIEATKQKSLSGYQDYVEGLENKRGEKVDDTFETLLTLGITDVQEAYRRALGAGLSTDDAKAVARQTTSLTRTALYQKAIAEIISNRYTGHQAENYALSLGLSEDDAHELERIANVLNNLKSNPNYYYSSDYVQYIEDLKNTRK